MEHQTDLCLCLGTSLSGMNADRMANTPAQKSLRRVPAALGTVVVNLQKTPLDASSTVRVWSKLDDFFRALTTELNIEVKPKKQVIKKLKGDIFTVPYDAEGKLNPMCRMTLDLSPNAQIKIAPTTAPNAGVTGTVRNRDNLGWVVVVDKIRRLGAWWVAEAVEGLVDQLPVVNVKAKVTIVSAEGNVLASRLQSRNDNAVAQLVDMGFDAEAATAALAACNGDVLAATVMMTEGADAQL